MIYDNVELHNVDGVVEQDNGGVMLLRVPENVCEKISERGSKEMHEPTNSEIRFYSESDTIKITLSSVGGEALGVLFHGHFMTRDRIEVGEEPVTLEFTRSDYIKIYRERGLRHGPFDSGVWRFMFSGARGSLIFHSVEGEGVRPPRKTEVPSLRYLAYGTSLTAGRATTLPHLSYAFQTAWRLGADLINIGSGGSCFIESDMADYLASRTDWDFMTMGLSLNMMKWDFDDFEKRVRYIIEKMTTAHPSKHIFCITNWPCFNDYRIFPNLEEGKTEKDIPFSEDYRRILRQAFADSNAPLLHLLEGPELFQFFGGESDDMIHPSDLGMIEMAQNLSDAIRPWL